MNDITILQEMLSAGAQVPLQQSAGSTSVKLKDKQAKTSVEITDIPHDSLVIRAEVFKPPHVFRGLKGERRRADFVIVSNAATEKWIICIETQRSTGKDSEQVEQQLRGAECFIGYCKCIGKSFWQSQKFLDGYQYRFVSIVNINIDKQITRFYKPKNQLRKKLHDRPENFQEIEGHQSLHFNQLT
ncbi:hypothetical protein F4Y93_13385 [Candidatus Poribacteria bacterium]|nr:hypothetical protein [Candidatus Poribacteria bacterium]